jgi:hypothetical protein
MKTIYCTGNHWNLKSILWCKLWARLTASGLKDIGRKAWKKWPGSIYVNNVTWHWWRGAACMLWTECRTCARAVLCGERTWRSNIIDSCAEEICQLLGAFGKLQKATVSFVMSVLPHGTRLPMDGFSWNFIFEGSWKICRLYSSLIEIWQE